MSDEPNPRIGALVATVLTEAEGLAALAAALPGPLGAKMLAAVDLIFDRVQGRLIVTGMGKSGHIARKIASTLASTGTPAMFVHPAEASHGDLGMIRGEDAVLALSWSGEAPELADIIAYARRFGVPLIAITSRPDSTLGAASDICLDLPRMPEACPNGLAPTTSTAMQLVAGDVLAVALLEKRNFSSSQFRDFHPGGRLGARLKRALDVMHGGTQLPLVRDTALLREAIVEMTGKRFGVTGVLDAQGMLVGVVTDGDVRRSLQREDALAAPVAALMTRSPRTAPPSMLASELLGLMNTARITSIFVVEAGLPTGIVHVHDLLAAGIV